MAQADVIKEFLVALGFKVDKKGLNDFTGGIENSTKAVAGLVAGIEASALAVSAMVSAFASNLEQLYFSSKRVDSSALNLKALGAAAQNLGVDSSEAVGNVEALARALRNNPGTEGLIQSLGVQTRLANGNMRDTSEMLVDIGKKMQGMEPYMRTQVGAGWFGMSEKMILALSDPQFASELAKQQAIIKDAGYDKAAGDAHEFEMKLRGLQSRIAAVGVQIEGSLLKALGPDLDEVTKWFTANSDKIASGTTTVSTSIVNAGSIILPILGKIAEGWKLIYELVRDTGAAINRVIPESWGNKIGQGTNWLFEKLGIADQVMDIYNGKKPTASSSPVSRGNKSDAQYFMDYMTQKHGWEPHQVAGMAGNVKNESSFNPDAVNGSHYGLAQWDETRQKNFEKWSGHSIHGSSREEQMDFMNYELTMGSEKKAGALLRATKNASSASDSFYQNYERAGAFDRTGERRASDAVQISQQTTIHVNGGDPAATGKAVAAEQERVNANMARNHQTVLQ